MDASNQVTVRPWAPRDVTACAQICFTAFADIADRHGFPRDFPSLEAAEGMLAMWATVPSIWGAVAEMGGRIVGSIFVHEYDAPRSLGPCTVSVDARGARVGRALVEAGFARAGRAHSVRGVEDGYNLLSNSLYASCGLELKEPLMLMMGRTRRGPDPGYEVRRLEDRDLGACEALHQAVHGFARTNELRGALRAFQPFVALRGGRVVAYGSSMAQWTMNHGVAETEDDVMALLRGSSAALDGPVGLLVPRRPGVFRRCLADGLRAMKPMNLVIAGTYQEPRGAWFPNVLY